MLIDHLPLYAPSTLRFAVNRGHMASSLTRRGLAAQRHAVACTNCSYRWSGRSRALAARGAPNRPRSASRGRPVALAAVALAVDTTTSMQPVGMEHLASFAPGVAAALPPAPPIRAAPQVLPLPTEFPPLPQLTLPPYEQVWPASSAAPLQSGGRPPPAPCQRRWRSVGTRPACRRWAGRGGTARSPVAGHPAQWSARVPAARRRGPPGSGGTADPRRPGGQPAGESACAASCMPPQSAAGAPPPAHSCMPPQSAAGPPHPPPVN